MIITTQFNQGGRMTMMGHNADSMSHAKANQIPIQRRLISPWTHLYKYIGLTIHILEFRLNTKFYLCQTFWMQLFCKSGSICKVKHNMLRWLPINCHDMKRSVADIHLHLPKRNRICCFKQPLGPSMLSNWTWKTAYQQDSNIWHKYH